MINFFRRAMSAVGVKTVEGQRIAFVTSIVLFIVSLVISMATIPALILPIILIALGILAIGVIIYVLYVVSCELIK